MEDWGRHGTPGEFALKFSLLWVARMTLVLLTHQNLPGQPPETRLEYAPKKTFLIKLSLTDRGEAYR